VRNRTPAGIDEDSSEQAAILREDHREVIAALAGLPTRRREAIVLRFWLDLPEREIAAVMGVSPGAVVTGREGVGTSQAILAGAAADTVASVTAVLPGGHWYPGTVKSGRGFAVKAWMVGYPINKGAHLVFRDASGKTVATLGTSGPEGPPQVPQPRSGGVTAFKYPAGDLTGPGGRVTAYLVQGRVGFWSAPSGGKISPVPSAGPPALGGLILPFGQRSGQNHPEIEEGFGYAHANVTRVVLRLPGGRTVSASTFAAGWSGSDLRLWAVVQRATLGGTA
jgi:Sigma-70, region 4